MDGILDDDDADGVVGEDGIVIALLMMADEEEEEEDDEEDGTMDRFRLSCCCSCVLCVASLRFCGTLCCRAAVAAALVCSTLVSSGTNSSEKDLARLFCWAICLTKSLQSIKGCERTLKAMLRPHEGYLRWNNVYQREGSCPILKAYNTRHLVSSRLFPPLFRTQLHL